MLNAPKVELSAEEKEAEALGVKIDPKTAEKIAENRERIIEVIREQRPRIAPTFEQMTIEGHTIRVNVPSAELHDEILRNKTPLLLIFVKQAQIDGFIELEVLINETVRAARPIRLEDRVQYMTDKNPLLVEFRKQLELDVE